MIKLDDSKNLLRAACDDLEALRTVVLMADREDCLSVEGDILPVTARALIPIIADIREAIEGIEKELGKAHGKGANTDHRGYKGSNRGH